MAKSSNKSQKNVEPGNKKMEKGTLSNSKSAKKIANSKQATGLVKAKKKVAKVSTPNKNVAKKTVSKKTATKKAAAKKAGLKKSASKKTIIKKAAVKKAAPKKALPKKAAANKLTPVNKKAANKKQAIKKEIKENTNLEAPTELSEELTQQPPEPNQIINPVIEPSGDALKVPVKIEDPLTSFDKHVYQKATIKGDPHSKLHLSSVNKSTIRPSGKKPLWRK